jgi:solute carrier family 35, member E1
MKDATTTTTTSAAAAASRAWVEWFELLVLMVVWNVFSVMANVYIKLYLAIVPCPGVMTLAQYVIGAFMITIWQVLQNLLCPSPPTRSFDSHTSLRSDSHALSSSTTSTLLLWLCLVNGVGHLLTNMSMSAVSVSFTHTVKAAEPLFSVLLAYVFLNQPLTLWISLSLLPIVSGIVLATATELNYDHFGFATAMLSNFVFSARNIISKRLQQASAIDNLTLFLRLSQAGAVMMVPYVLYAEHLPTALFGDGGGASSDAPSSNVLILLLLKAGVCHCIYNLVSFILLSRISAITHAIGNSMKRVILVVGGWLYFGVANVTRLNVFGSILASIGVLCYSFASRAAPGANTTNATNGHSMGSKSKYHTTNTNSNTGKVLPI